MDTFMELELGPGRMVEPSESESSGLLSSWIGFSGSPLGSSSRSFAIATSAKDEPDRWNDRVGEAHNGPGRIAFGGVSGETIFSRSMRFSNRTFIFHSLSQRFKGTPLYHAR